MARLGIISDTHGILDPRVARAFADVDAIVHAGDICDSTTVPALRRIVPEVWAVQGNCDEGHPAAAALPELLHFDFAGAAVVVAHQRVDLEGVGLDDADLLVYGHTHEPNTVTIGNAVWVNPGSATYPGMSPLGRSVAIAQIEPDGSVTVEHLALDDF